MPDDTPFADPSSNAEAAASEVKRMSQCEGEVVFGGRYRLKRYLSRGGMGVVWLAEDLSLGTDVALKFLPELVVAEAAAVLELKRETRRARELAHANIVKVYDFAEDGRTAAITMEYVNGETLGALRLKQPHGVFAPSALAGWVDELGAALDYAHTKAKVVHRDLKPGNLMVSVAGDLKVMDFGIAATLSETATRVSKVASSSGSPPYMSPQQIMGKRATVADDVYAVGATLYELLTGKPPFYKGDVFGQVLNVPPMALAARRAELLAEGAEAGGATELLSAAPTRLAGDMAGAGAAVLAEIPAHWEATILACLAKEPEHRPASVGEVARRLRGEGAKEATMATEATAPAMTAPETQKGAREGSEAKKEKGSEGGAGRGWGLLVAGLVLGVVLALGAGYYFTVAAPARAAKAEAARVERARLAEERAEAEKIRLAEEKAAAELRAAREAEERAMLTKIAAVTDGAARALLDETGREVEAYVQAAETAYAERVEAAWTLRKAEWERAWLAAARGGLIVRTVPPGAEVTVGVIEAGLSPLTVREARLGRYPITATLAGYEDHAEEAEVGANTFRRVDITLVRSVGSASLDSDPAGLAYVLTGPDGVRRTGRTPAKEEKLPTGEYLLTVTREGYPDGVVRMDVKRGAQASGQVLLAGGRLEVSSTPSGAEIYDAAGKRLGETPHAFVELPPGKYLLEFRLAGHTPKRIEAEVRAKQTTRVAESLEKLPFPQANQAYENTLGMKFVPVAGTEVLFGVWETREQDYGAFATATGRAWSSAKAGDTHPAVYVSWDDAQAFCAWLTQKERGEGKIGPSHSYRLPTDHEWSVAVGLREDATASPSSKDGAIRDQYPWGTRWPPPKGAGNYDSSLAVDEFAGTAPVGSFVANAFGLHDMGGNVWEWVDGKWQTWSDRRFVRGASFLSNDSNSLLSSSRDHFVRGATIDNNRIFGFRVVLVVGRGSLVP